MYSFTWKRFVLFFFVFFAYRNRATDTKWKSAAQNSCTPVHESFPEEMWGEIFNKCLQTSFEAGTLLMSYPDVQKRNFHQKVVADEELWEPQVPPDFDPGGRVRSAWCMSSNQSRIGEKRKLARSTLEQLEVSPTKLENAHVFDAEVVAHEMYSRAWRLLFQASTDDSTCNQTPFSNPVKKLLHSEMLTLLR